MGSLVKKHVTSLVCVALVAASFFWPQPAFARSASAVANDLAAARAKAGTAGRQYDRAFNAYEDTDWRIRQTDKRIAAEQRELARTEAALGHRADAMYRSGDEVDGLSFILGATSFDDFITRADIVTLIGNRDAALIKKVKDTQARLDRNRKALLKDRKQEKAELAVFKKKRDVLQKKLASVQGEYNRLLGELSAAMAAEKAAGISTWSPPGPNGMIFPVRGAHYYSDTWGAARSGGRSHKGTDIMSPKGTPVVAIVSGSVSAKTGGLGGMTISLSGSNGWEFYYAHLSRYAVTSGHVSAGQVIGYVGDTGNARGGSPHLHLQMGPGGHWVNPYSYLRRME